MYFKTYLFSHTTMNSVNSYHVYALKGCHSPPKIRSFRHLWIPQHHLGWKMSKKVSLLVIFVLLLLLFRGCDIITFIAKGAGGTSLKRVEEMATPNNFMVERLNPYHLDFEWWFVWFNFHVLFQVCQWNFMFSSPFSKYLNPLYF